MSLLWISDGVDDAELIHEEVIMTVKIGVGSVRSFAHVTPPFLRVLDEEVAGCRTS